MGLQLSESFDKLNTGIKRRPTGLRSECCRKAKMSVLKRYEPDCLGETQPVLASPSASLSVVFGGIDSQTGQGKKTRNKVGLTLEALLTILQRTDAELNTPGSNRKTFIPIHSLSLSIPVFFFLSLPLSIFFSSIPSPPPAVRFCAGLGSVLPLSEQVKLLLSSVRKGEEAAPRR